MGMYRGLGNRISVAAYTGDRAVLLPFDLAADRVDGLAGFAVARLTLAREVPPCRPCKGRVLFAKPAELCKRCVCGTLFSSEHWEANKTATGGHDLKPPEWAEIEPDRIPLPPMG